RTSARRRDRTGCTSTFISSRVMRATCRRRKAVCGASWTDEALDRGLAAQELRAVDGLHRDVADLRAMQHLQLHLHAGRAARPQPLVEVGKVLDPLAAH